MTRLRIGTRGSDLALWQTNWVTDALKAAHPGLDIERIIIQTHGDQNQHTAMNSADWPAGSFVTALEDAMLQGKIDLAVHSCKDLPSSLPDKLTIAAMPNRNVVHDVLLTNEAVDLDRLPEGFRIGTSSPRRSAQFGRFCPGVTLVPLRGNVPTRISRLVEGKYDGIILAAAGMTRLNLDAPHITKLPTDRFVPAPSQGALAIETKRGTDAEALVAAIDDASIRQTVEAERAVLRAVAATCQTPVAALASLSGDTLSLHAQLFSDDFSQLAEGRQSGSDPVAVGTALGNTLKAELERSPCASG
jgi:hydroxymethylbilane synthase